MTPIRRVLDLLSAVSFGLAGVSLVAVTLVQAWQVFARYVLNDSPGWTEPVSLLLIGTTAMLGAAEAVRQERHFGFFTVRDSLPAPLAGFLKQGARGLIAACGVGIAVSAGVLAEAHWFFPMAGASVPTGAKYLPFAVGGGLMAVFAIERMLTGDPVPADDAGPTAEA